MFLIAGVTPKTKVLDGPRLCPVCGLAQAYLERIDHYLSLFFIPVVRVRTGEPFVVCRRCERPVDAVDAPGGAFQPARPEGCPSCGKLLEKDFRYCPHCGRPIRKGLKE
jgi:hypothetical protein